MEMALFCSKSPEKKKLADGKKNLAGGKENSGSSSEKTLPLHIRNTVQISPKSHLFRRAPFDFKLLAVVSFGPMKTATPWLLLPFFLIVSAQARPFVGSVQDAGGHPISGAKVVVSAPFFDAPAIAPLRSDERGQFRIELPDAPAANPEADYRTVQIEVPSGPIFLDYLGKGDAKTWTMPAATSLSGTVVDEDEQPVADAKVKVSYLSQNRSMIGYVQGLETRSDADGKWTLGRLPVGFGADIEVRAKGKALARFEVGFEPSAAPFPAVALSPGFDVRGTVRDDEGKPIAGTDIYANGPNHATTDERGQFALENLSLQAQDLQIAPGREGLFAKGRVVRATPEKTLLDIVLQRGVAVRGRLVDSVTGAPIAGGTVGFWNLGKNTSAKSDAKGEFQITVPPTIPYLGSAEAPNYQQHSAYFSEEQIRLRDVGNIKLERGTVWKGVVRVADRAAGEQLVFNLTRTTPIPLTEADIAAAKQDGRPAQPFFPNTQIQADADGNFQTAPLPSGEWKFNADQWKFQVVEPQSVVLPAPSDAPIVRDISARRIATFSARGRLQTPDGAPVPYANIVLKSAEGGYGRAVSRSDGSWEARDLVPATKWTVESVSLGEGKLGDGARDGVLDGKQWTFAPLVWSDSRRETRVAVRDAAGHPVAGARVLALFGKGFKILSTDAAGIALCQAPQGEVHFFAAKALDFGEATSQAGTPVAIELRAPDADAALVKAKIALAAPTDLALLTEFWGAVSETRLREVALRADGASDNPALAKANYGRFLSSLLYKEPDKAFAEIPFIERIAAPERERPFELRQAEESLALRAARADDDYAKAWATRWLQSAKRDFAYPVELKPEWAGGDQTGRYLAAYAVAVALKDPLARPFFDAALNALPDKESAQQGYSYPGYFAIDDPNIAVFRAALSPKNQVDFAASAAFRSQVETPAQAREGLAQLETLVASPAIKAKVPADSLLGSLDWARFQTLGFLLKDPQLPLRPVLEQLRALGSTYQAGSLALAGAQSAWDRGDKTLAREFIDLGRERNWFDERADFGAGDPKSKARIKFFDAAFPPASLVATAPDATLIGAAALANLRAGDTVIGNRMPDVGADGRLLRALDPALGRLVLEAKWARLGPITDNNRYDIVALASAMELYDPSRAFDWLDPLAGGNYHAHYEQLRLAGTLLAPEK